MPPRRHPVSDLVSDAKIETTILSDSIQHVFYAPGRSAQRRQEQRVENWSRERKLGEGAFGVVYLERCQQLEGDGGACKLRAVKQIKKHIVPGQELDYTRELEAIFKFSNPRYSHCFVRSDGWFEEGDYVFISMEYLEHGDLQTHLVRRPLPEIEARQITTQVLEGLEYMHENGFVHRDLKPSNIMVVSKSPEWFVKIADFGISKRRQQEGATTTDTMNKGTLGFTAPEVFGFGSGEGDSGVSYSFAVDLWSLGAVVYLMLTKTLLFPTLGDLFKYATGATAFPAGRLKAFQVSEQAHDFVAQLMVPTAVDRPTAKSAMGHLWMTTPLIQLKGTNSDGPSPMNENKRLGSNISDVSVASARWSYSSSERMVSIKTAETMPSSSSNRRPTVLGPITQMNKPHESSTNRDTKNHPASQSAAGNQTRTPVIHNTKVDQPRDSNFPSSSPSRDPPTKYLNPWFEDEDDDEDEDDNKTPVVHNPKTESQNTVQGHVGRSTPQEQPRQFLVPAISNANGSSRSLTQTRPALVPSVNGERQDSKSPARDRPNQSPVSYYVPNHNQNKSLFVVASNQRPRAKSARHSLARHSVANSQPRPPSYYPVAKPVTPVSPRLEPWTPLPPSVYFANTPPLLVYCQTCKRLAKRLESTPIGKCAHWICNPCLRRTFNDPMISVEAEATSSTTTTTTTATTTTDLEPPTCCPGSIIPLRAVLTMILNPEVRRRWINIYSSIRPSSESKTWTPAPTEWMRPHRTGPLRWRQTEVPPRRKGFSGVKRINFAYVLDDEEEQEEVEDKYGEEKDEQLVGTGSAGPKDMDVAAASAPREHSTSPTGSRVSFTAGESTISSSVLRSREIRLKAESQLGELLAKPKRLHGREGAATDTERESSTSPPGGKAAVDVAAAAAAAAVAAISTGRPGDPQPSQTDEKTWYAEMSKRFDLAGRKPVNPPGRVNGTLPKTNSLNKPGANGPGASEQRLPSILKKYTSTTDARFNPNHWSGSVVQDSSNGEKGLGAGKVPVVRRRASTVAIRVGNAD